MIFIMFIDHNHLSFRFTMAFLNWKASRVTPLISFSIPIAYDKTFGDKKRFTAAPNYNSPVLSLRLRNLSDESEQFGTVRKSAHRTQLQW